LPQNIVYCSDLEDWLAKFNRPQPQTALMSSPFGAQLSERIDVAMRYRIGTKMSWPVGGGTRDPDQYAHCADSRNEGLRKTPLETLVLAKGRSRAMRFELRVNASIPVRSE